MPPCHLRLLRHAVRVSLLRRIVCLKIGRDSQVRTSRDFGRRPSPMAFVGQNGMSRLTRPRALQGLMSHLHKSAWPCKCPASVLMSRSAQPCGPSYEAMVRALQGWLSRPTSSPFLKGPSAHSHRAACPVLQGFLSGLSVPRVPPYKALSLRPPRRHAPSYKASHLFSQGLIILSNKASCPVLQGRTSRLTRPRYLVPQGVMSRLTRSPRHLQRRARGRPLTRRIGDLFFAPIRSMPTANAEDPCRSEGTQRRIPPRPFPCHPPIRSSPRRSPSACAE